MPAWLADIGSGLAGLFTSKSRTQFERPLAYVKKTLAMATHQSYDDVLETMFNEFMTSAENEHNWQKRLKLCDQLTNLLKIKPEVPRNFWDKTKMILGSIVMAAGSERTQLSGGACKLIGLMFQTLGSQMHPYIETVVPTFLQISGATKKINQVNGNNTMTTIIQFCGYNNRLLYHICATFNDKRKEARAWAPAWLTLFLQTYEHALDPAKDYPVIEKAILTGLNDGDLKTRETTRAAYWNFSNINEPATNRIMETLNTHAQNALKSDKNNPHKTTAPAKAAKSGASALAKIRAQSKQQAAVEAQTKGKRDFSDTSIKSQPMVFGSIDRLNDPDGLLKPQNIVGPAETRRLEKQHERLVALGIRDEATPIYETGERTRDPLQLRTKSSKAHISEAKRAKDAEAHPAEPESSTHARPFLSAPVRRPRVVATPMTQPQPTSRPTSKGEATRKPETRDRPQPGRGGRQTPVIVEENFSESQRQPVSKIYKSSAQMEQKSIAGTPSTSRPSSSSSEPAGIRGPRSLTKQSSSTNVLPTRHQKAASASESRGHKSVVSSNASMDYSKLKTMSPPGPVMLAFPKPETLASSATTNDKSIDYSKLKTMSPPSSVNLPFSRPETLATTIASSDKSIDYSKLQTMSPPSLVLPFPAKENPVELHQGKTSADEALSKAKRSLPNIIAALKEGKLDALGYRKLKKLIQNYPGVLFNDFTQDQYDALYRALISQFASIEEAVEPREQKRANFNHPMYSRMAVIDMLHMLMTQYPYGEPEPGMTVVALLIAKASYGEFHTMMEDKIRVSINFFLGAVCHRWSPLPVIDCVTDALFELDQVMRSNEPENVATPTWSRVLDLDRPPRLFMKSVLDARRDQSLRSVDIWPEHGQSVKSQHSVLSEESVMSHISEFGPTPPKLLARLTDVMMLGLNILTFLLNFGRQNGFILYDIQQQRLVGLLTVAVTTYRHLMKENIMEFSAALYDTIKPEERFRGLFENQSDLNLVYYSIAKQKQGGTGSVNGRNNDDAGSLESNVGLGSLS